MWFINRRRKQRRKIFGFPCDQSIALGVRILAAHLEVPIYVVAEHLLQIGASLALPALDDEELRKELHEHLVNEHLLSPSLDDRNQYDQAVAAKALGKKLN